MYTSVITKADKVTLQEDGSMFLDVEFEIKNEGETIEIRKLAFPLDTPSSDILDEVAKYTANYEYEMALKDQNAQRDAVYAAADETIEAIIGQEVVVN